MQSTRTIEYTNDNLFDDFYFCANNKSKTSLKKLIDASKSILNLDILGLKKNNHTLLSQFASEGKHEIVEWLYNFLFTQFPDSMYVNELASGWRWKKCSAESMLETKYLPSEIAAGYAMGNHFKDVEATIRTLCSIKNEDLRNLIIKEANLIKCVPPIGDDMKNIIDRAKHSNQNLDAVVDEGVHRINAIEFINKNNTQKNAYCCFRIFAFTAGLAVTTIGLISNTYTP